MLPKFSTYGRYSSANYGAHALTFWDASGNQYWFSYKTLVAFETTSGRRVVLQNYWGPTTGKHLNAIDGGRKSERVTQEAFNNAFLKAFGLEAAKIVSAA